MQKIKDELIKKIYKIHLSKFALSVLLDLIQIADENGRVQIYYKDIVKNVMCSRAQFYNVLKKLERFNLIKREKGDEYKNEIDITILGNNFADSYRNYVNINSVFFAEYQYHNMKAVEIRLYLYFLFRVSKQKYDGKNDKNKLFYNGAYKKIAGQLGMKECEVKRHCRLLRAKGYICIGRQKVDKYNEKYDVITLNKKSTREPVVTVTEKGKKSQINAKPLHFHWCHYIKNSCRRNKKTYNTDNLNDTAILFGQYEKKAREQGQNIYNILSNAIKNLSDTVLNSRTIHRIVKNMIQADYMDSIILY